MPKNKYYKTVVKYILKLHVLILDCKIVMVYSVIRFVMQIVKKDNIVQKKKK